MQAFSEKYATVLLLDNSNESVQPLTSKYLCMNENGKYTSSPSLRHFKPTSPFIRQSISSYPCSSLVCFSAIGELPEKTSCKRLHVLYLFSNQKCKQTPFLHSKRHNGFTCKDPSELCFRLL